MSGFSGKMAVLSGVVAAWLIFDMATATEAPRQAVLIMEYIFLAGSLLGVVGWAVTYISRK